VIESVRAENGLRISVKFDETVMQKTVSCDDLDGDDLDGDDLTVTTMAQNYFDSRSWAGLLTKPIHRHRILHHRAILRIC
jgi:hypothetical protein